MYYFEYCPMCLPSRELHLDRLRPYSQILDLTGKARHGKHSNLLYLAVSDDEKMFDITDGRRRRDDGGETPTPTRTTSPFRTLKL